MEKTTSSTKNTFTLEMTNGQRRKTTLAKNDPQNDKTNLKTHRKQNSDNNSNKHPGRNRKGPYHQFGKKIASRASKEKAYSENFGDQS